MKGITYDLHKLSDSGLFDLNASTRFFYTMREYFDALCGFEKDFSRDLKNYTPVFLINDETNRELFIRECFEIRAVLTGLGMVDLLKALDVLENAAITKREKAFSDGQVKFAANINIYKDTIRKAEHAKK